MLLKAKWISLDFNDIICYGNWDKNETGTENLEFEHEQEYEQENTYKNALIYAWDGDPKIAPRKIARQQILPCVR